MDFYKIIQKNIYSNLKIKEVEDQENIHFFDEFTLILLFLEKKLFDINLISSNIKIIFCNLTYTSKIILKEVVYELMESNTVSFIELLQKVRIL